ncbi:MAG: type II toxin-antitoxin system ParD family antitoxin [Caulobacteraceae bacterium]
MNISLTPELERRIAEKVETGLYNTASEVVREALRLLFSDEEARRRTARALLDSEIRAGLDELDRGESVDGDEAYRQAGEVIERSHRRRG